MQKTRDPNRPPQKEAMVGDTGTRELKELAEKAKERADEASKATAQEQPQQRGYPLGWCRCCRGPCGYSDPCPGTRGNACYCNNYVAAPWVVR